MKVLVTGGTGFIGSNLVLELMNRPGLEIMITGNDSEQRIPGFKGKILHPSFVGIDFDAIGHVDVLHHQAAINDTQFSDRNEIFRANVESSRVLFDHVIKNGCKRIVYATSTATYGNEPAPYIEGKTRQTPINPYGESKVELEKLAINLAEAHPDVNFVGLRYCNVFGPRESHKGKRANIIYHLARQMIGGDPKIFKHGEQSRDYLYIKDAVRATLLAAETEFSGIVNCGSGTATSFNDVIKTLNKVLGLNRNPIYIDNPYSSNYQDHTECDMALAREKIGFVPRYNLEEGIRDYYESGFLVPR